MFLTTTPSEKTYIFSLLRFQLAMQQWLRCSFFNTAVSQAQAWIPHWYENYFFLPLLLLYYIGGNNGNLHVFFVILLLPIMIFRFQSFFYVLSSSPHSKFNVRKNALRRIFKIKFVFNTISIKSWNIEVVSILHKFVSLFLQCPVFLNFMIVSIVVKIALKIESRLLLVE